MTRSRGTRKDRGAGFTERLARTSALHPWRTIGVWAALIVLAVLAVGSLLGSGLTSEKKFRAGEPGSVTADRLIEERLSGPHKVTDFVIVRSATRTVDDPAFKGYVLDSRRRSTPSAAMSSRPPPPTTRPRIPAFSPRTSTPRSSP